MSAGASSGVKGSKKPAPITLTTATTPDAPPTTTSIGPNPSEPTEAAAAIAQPKDESAQASTQSPTTSDKVNATMSATEPSGTTSVVIECKDGVVKTSASGSTSAKTAPKYLRSN